MVKVEELDKLSFPAGMRENEAKELGYKELHPSLFSGYVFLDDPLVGKRAIYEPDGERGYSLRKIIDIPKE